MKAVAIVPGNLKQNAENIVPIVLSSCYHWCHSGTVQHELDRILGQTSGVQGEEEGVLMNDFGVELFQSSPGGGEGGAS